MSHCVVGEGVSGQLVVPVDPSVEMGALLFYIFSLLSQTLENRRFIMKFFCKMQHFAGDTLVCQLHKCTQRCDFYRTNIPGCDSSC